MKGNVWKVLMQFQMNMYRVHIFRLTFLGHKFSCWTPANEEREAQWCPRKYWIPRPIHSQETWPQLHTLFTSKYFPSLNPHNTMLWIS